MSKKSLIQYQGEPRAVPIRTGGARPGSLLDNIGGTPLLDLTPLVSDSLHSGVEVYAKAEWFNPGGSVKDRAALSMIRQLESEKRIAPGSTLLDASSGNTGIALAMIAAERGYRLVLALPKNANAERKRLLKAYGAEIMETSPLEGSDGAIREAQRLAAENPDWIYVDQYNNEWNWKAHFNTTGPELIQQTDGRLTHFVAGLGTGGTFTGTGRYLKEIDESISLVELQPAFAFHGLEGWKHMESAIVPSIWDPDLADRRLGVPTEAAYEWVRRLAKHGILLGPSGGAAMWGAMTVASELTDGVVVTIFADSGVRYLSDSHLWGEKS